MFNKRCQWLDSNPGPLVSEATALPTAPQPLVCFLLHHLVTLSATLLIGHLILAVSIMIKEVGIWYVANDFKLIYWFFEAIKLRWRKWFNRSWKIMIWSLCSLFIQPVYNRMTGFGKLFIFEEFQKYVEKFHP